MGDGHCHYGGTISCPYHGWTFDENGDCLAVLGEGPESPIPGNEGARLKVYPTATLKGLVFIWMGKRDPAPLEQDIPPQFFLNDVDVQVSVSNWSCNWRQAVENINDAHVFYVHHNSFNFLKAPENIVRVSKNGPTRPRPTVVNGRGVKIDSTAILRPPGGPFRDAYAGLGNQLFPKHQILRLAWAKVMSKTMPLRPKVLVDAPWAKDDEWVAFHLPGIFRAFDTGRTMYTRFVVPIDRGSSRMFYLHTTRGRSRSESVGNQLWFKLIYNWWVNYNFSGQDQAVMEPQTYDQPEALSASDIFPLAIRRLIVECGRDFQDIKPQGG